LAWLRLTDAANKFYVIDFIRVYMAVLKALLALDPRQTSPEVAHAQTDLRHPNRPNQTEQLYQYRFGSAEFDESRQELKVGGLRVEVERKALAVLQYLLRHVGEIVTKEELLCDVWSGRITVEQVLPNAINKLRRALGQANAERILTQARIGYRLEGPVARTAVGRAPSSEFSLVIGQTVAERPNFTLCQMLGKTLGSEVWLAQHGRTGEQRVYKFARDADHLRALKREVTLLSVLQASVADCSHFIGMIDWNFERAPFFLESEFGGQNLSDWATTHLSELDQGQRIGLFLQIADALTSAHSVGVLHKDIKPSNILVQGSGAQTHARLIDFGNARLLDLERLDALGIAPMGMTVTEGRVDSSGTPMYMAPELLAGQAPTVQSDVYALGLLLYQLLAGRMGHPMVSGWEADVSDPMLQADLRQATAGEAEQRLASAAELSTRLRQLEQRRLLAQQQQQLQREATQARVALARTRARRPFLLALIVVLLLGAAVAIVLQQAALRARNEARIELERANAITRFLNEDLIGRSNPLVSAKGADATLKEVLLAARARVTLRFAKQPLSEAKVRSSLATLFNAIDLWPQAIEETQTALKLLEAQGGANTSEALQARSTLVRILARSGGIETAEKEFQTLTRLLKNTTSAQSQYWQNSAGSTIAIARGNFTDAVTALQAAIAALTEFDPGNFQLDSLRLDLIACYTMAAQPEPAKRVADALIAEARTRQEDSGLLIASAKLAVARAYGMDHEKVQALLQEAQAVIVARLGENHSRNLQVLGELLGVAFRRGDWPLAERYAQSLHERVKVKLGEKHPLTYLTLTNWGRAQYERGNAKEAAPKLRLAHARLVEIIGKTSPQTQEATFALTSVELALGHLAAAEALLAELDIEALKSGRASDWENSANALRGIWLYQSKRMDAARPLLAAALKIQDADPDPGRLWLEARAALAAIERVNGEPKKSIN
jgi:eukaryotic-like serine/threonine-protein kinase